MRDRPNFTHKEKSDDRHQHFAPSPALRPYIKCFHSLEIDDADGDEPYERFTPDGCAEMNFNLAGPPQRRDATHAERRLEPAYTVARSSTSYFMRPAGVVRLVGARFHPWGLHAFTSVPLDEITDNTAPSAALFGVGVDDLHERISRCTKVNEAIAELEDFLLAKRVFHEEDPMVIDAARRIERSNGTIAMAEVLMPYGIGQRRFQQRFLQCIGTPAKVFARLMRFQHSLRMLTADREASQLDLAFEGNYFDQSHFVNEFTAFAGASPTRYLAEVHPLNDAAVLGHLEDRAR
jgi:AraC-like DNA-binding protein